MSACRSRELDTRSDAFARTLQPNVLMERPGARLAALLTCRNALAPANPVSGPPLNATVASPPYASLVAMFANVLVATPALSIVRSVRTASSVRRKNGVS